MESLFLLKILKKKLKTLKTFTFLSIALSFFLQVPTTCLSKDNQQIPQIIKFEKTSTTNTWDNTSNYDIKITDPQKYCSPSLLFLTKQDLSSYCSLQNKIEKIGISTLENILNKALYKEIELQYNYHVFYHGQKLEFLLFQDLLKQLNKIVYQKAFVDFIMLRIPDKDFHKYETAEKFLKKFNYSISDFQDPQRKLLLSVMPFLFGSATFNYYFLNSDNAFFISNKDLTKKIFEYFNLENYYKKYKKELDTLLKLLSEYDDEKTGLLLQIFVPKDIITKAAYRAAPGGTPYYSNWHNPPLIKKTSGKELEEFHQQPFMQQSKSWDLNSIEFRLFLYDKLMLNPDNDKIKFFRYYNKTKKIKKYKEKLNKLIEQISQDLESDDPKLQNWASQHKKSYRKRIKRFVKKIMKKSPLKNLF